MKSLKRDLFERRLWPLAVAIIAAIVAVPFLLHGHAATADIAPPPPSAGAASTTPAPATHHPHAHRQRATPLSHTRDPFQAGTVAKVRTSSSTTATTTTTSPAATTPVTGSSPVSSAAGSPVAGSGAGASAPASSPAAATAPVASAPVTTTTVSTPRAGAAPVPASWDIYSVDLRVGAPGSPVAYRNPARLTPLPSPRSPQVMYMGVADHGRDGVFALGAGVEVRAVGGDRSAGAFCHPSRVDCALVVVPAGKRVGLLYVSATGTNRALVLRVSRITSSVTSSAGAAKLAREHVSALGLCDLKLGDPIGFFDPSAESVTVPSVSACRRDRRAVPFPGSLGAGSSVRG